MKINKDLMLCLNNEKKAVGQHPILLGIRIRLARNLEEFPFPNKANADQKKAIWELCQKAFIKTNVLTNPSCVEIDQLNAVEKKLLLETHCASAELISDGIGRGLVFDHKKRFSLMVNEEDHLRLQVLSKENNFRKAWASIDDLDTELENYLDYAFSPEWGYLTACPTNLGTGMRASAMLHLPALVLTDQIKQVIRALTEMGMAVRGLFGEQSKATGNIFQISNQSSLGNEEESLLLQIESVVERLIKKELFTRDRLLNEDGVQLIDKISRALGLLRTSYFTSADEAINLLSFIHLGIDIGCFPKFLYKFTQSLWTQVQPAHLKVITKTQTSLDEEDGKVRAEFLRKMMANFPNPDYSFFK